MKTTQIINKLKENDQDFEWYPTDSAIVQIIAKDLKHKDEKGFSLLDIGAGNGNIFKLLKDHDCEPVKKYAIEKSSILTSQMEPNVFIIGTDFDHQTLIDKKIDVIFCNPPYSKYEEWVVKIIEESFCDIIYLVIPDRWKDNERIQKALKSRKANAHKIGSFDFLDSQYRKARAKVDILSIKISDSYYNRETCKVDPFDLWFDKNFKIDINKEDSYDHLKSKSENIQSQIIKGQNLIERLVELYNNDMAKLIDNYKSLEKMDCELLKELNASIQGLKEGLKLKITCL